MKTQSSFFVLIALSTLFLTACQNDGIVDKIDPSMTRKVDDANMFSSASSSKAGSTFNFDEQVIVIASAVRTSESLKSTRPRVNESSIALSGFGDSEINNRGSWYVELDLVYNPNSDGVSGTVLFEFPDLGEHAEFVVYGGPSLVTEKIDGQEVEVLQMQLALVRGNGKFAAKKFEGTARLTPVDQLGSGKTLKPQLEVIGVLTDK